MNDQFKTLGYTITTDPDFQNERFGLMWKSNKCHF